MGSEYIWTAGSWNHGVLQATPTADYSVGWIADIVGTRRWIPQFCSDQIEYHVWMGQE